MKFYKSLDNEAIRVVKKMPQWIPGYFNGMPINRHFVMLATWPEFGLFILLFGFFFVNSAAINSKKGLNQDKNP